MSLEHIPTGIDERGQAWVQVDDAELFDYVEDVLVEQHDLQHLWCHSSNDSGRSSFTMTFHGDLMPRIQAALASLDPEEIRRIYLLNNPESSA